MESRTDSTIDVGELKKARDESIESIESIEQFVGSSVSGGEEPVLSTSPVVNGGGESAAVLDGTGESAEVLDGTGDSAATLAGTGDSPSVLDGGTGDLASVLDGTGDSAPVLDGTGDSASVLDGGGEPAAVLDGGGEPAAVLDGGGEPAAVLVGGDKSAEVLEGSVGDAGVRLDSDVDSAVLGNVGESYTSLESDEEDESHGEAHEEAAKKDDDVPTSRWTSFERPYAEEPMYRRRRTPTRPEAGESDGSTDLVMMDVGDPVPADPSGAFSLLDGVTPTLSSYPIASASATIPDTPSPITTLSEAQLKTLAKFGAMATFYLKTSHGEEISITYGKDFRSKAPRVDTARKIREMVIKTYISNSPEQFDTFETDLTQIYNDIFAEDDYLTNRMFFNKPGSHSFLANAIAEFFLTLQASGLSSPSHDPSRDSIKNASGFEPTAAASPESTHDTKIIQARNPEQNPYLYILTIIDINNPEDFLQKMLLRLVNDEIILPYRKLVDSRSGLWDTKESKKLALRQISAEILHLLGPKKDGLNKVAMRQQRFQAKNAKNIAEYLKSFIDEHTTASFVPDAHHKEFGNMLDLLDELWDRIGLEDEVLDNAEERSRTDSFSL